MTAYAVFAAPAILACIIIALPWNIGRKSPPDNDDAGDAAAVESVDQIAGRFGHE